VNRLALFRSARAFGVLVMLAAWFALSNHCALLALQHVAQAEHQCCHTSLPGSSEPPGSHEGVCCKTLRAVPLESAVKPANPQTADELFATAWVPSSHAGVEAYFAGVVVEATGPPRSLSFAEVVLQRSVLSHAPPLLA
jgi:hypothetical protein